MSTRAQNLDPQLDALEKTQCGVDTSTPTGRLIFNMFATITEYERELIRERVQAARDSVVARGIGFGRPRKLGADDAPTSGSSWRPGSRPARPSR